MSLYTEHCIGGGSCDGDGGYFGAGVLELGVGVVEERGEARPPILNRKQ